MKKGREGEEEIFAHAKRAPLQKGGGRRGAGRGEVRGREGGEAYSPVHPLIYNANLNATVGPADLFVPLRNKSSSLIHYSMQLTLLHL